jgi:uracil-DNA glycosylase
LSDVRVILALGRVAFETYARYLKERGIETRHLKFQHGASYKLPKPYPILVASYHPSRQNTQTGKLTPPMFDAVFVKIHRLLVNPDGFA